MLLFPWINVLGGRAPVRAGSQLRAPSSCTGATQSRRWSCSSWREVSVPWARFDLQSQGNTRAFERNLQAKGKAWGKKNPKKQLGTTVRDLYFQLHFPALMSSYFQGIQIMQSRCFYDYHFKDFFFSQEIKKSFYSCFISTNDFAFGFLTSN